MFGLIVLPTIVFDIPAAVLTIHGSADRFNHHELRVNSPPYWRMGVATAIEPWRTANGCGLEPIVGEFWRAYEIGNGVR